MTNTFYSTACDYLMIGWDTFSDAFPNTLASTVIGGSLLNLQNGTVAIDTRTDEPIVMRVDNFLRDAHSVFSYRDAELALYCYCKDGVLVDVVLPREIDRKEFATIVSQSATAYVLLDGHWHEVATPKFETTKAEQTPGGAPIDPPLVELINDVTTMQEERKSCPSTRTLIHTSTT